MHVAVTGPEQCFDFRDLAAAPRGSCRYSRAVSFQVCERAAIPVEGCALARKRLPAHYDYVHEARIQLDGPGAYSVGRSS